MSRLSYLQFFITDVRVVVSGDIAVVTCAENVLTDLPNSEGGEGTGLAGGEAP